MFVGKMQSSRLKILGSCGKIDILSTKIDKSEGAM